MGTGQQPHVHLTCWPNWKLFQNDCIDKNNFHIKAHIIFTLVAHFILFRGINPDKPFEISIIAHVIFIIAELCHVTVICLNNQKKKNATNLCRIMDVITTSGRSKRELI